MAETKKEVTSPTWQQIHEDLNNNHVGGVYGGCNSAFHGLAALRAGVDLKEFHTHRSPDEFYLPDIEAHIKNPENQKDWDRVVTFDPMGMFANTPTMSATTASCVFPELQGHLERDGVVVDKRDGGINVQKIAVDYVWNVPRFSSRLGFAEAAVRKALADYGGNPTILDEKLNAYLPPVGGFTIYFVGDVKKLGNPKTEIAVRVHDSCCGSDVFGTDICTCRPYLVFAMQAAAECAQRGGVGIIIYYQKEGRSLGEVTKYRVYNARKRQEGGDRAETYFHQTESIAGIRDARFQEMMPDALNWLGIRRIDWLLSMSSEKYDAITAAGIQVMQRVALPDLYVPKNAHVEITAKISSGYHSSTVETEDVIDSLRSLEMIRSRSTKVFNLAQEGKSQHFNIDLKQMDTVADYVIDVTKTNYPNLNIPYHSRWRHFDSKVIADTTAAWPCDKVEAARRKIDLATVSVLLDAGAGKKWHYRNRRDELVYRSEGLAIASQDMFLDGLFSSDPCVPHRVNSVGLKSLSLKQFSAGMQVNEHNPIVGLEGRHGLLQTLGDALELNPTFFGREVCRPGNMVDYILANCDGKTCSIKVLWKAVIEGFEPVWPANSAGVRRGDVWVYSMLKEIGVPGSDMVPFHKLSQWLTYSLMEPIEDLGIKFTDVHLLTGLPEYRNGGLLVDLGLIVPKRQDILDMAFHPGSEVIVEWRALTVIMLDKLAEAVRTKLGKTADEMPLAKILQGGTWPAGRKIAGEKRSGMPPPITVRSDGTVF